MFYWQQIEVMSIRKQDGKNEIYFCTVQSLIFAAVRLFAKRDRPCTVFGLPICRYNFKCHYNRNQMQVLYY